jgi:nitrogen-specific signal transduction histidine kinase
VELRLLVGAVLRGAAEEGERVDLGQGAWRGKVDNHCWEAGVLFEEDKVGLEATCAVRFGTQASQGRAQLEATELVFRGGFRLKIPLKDVASVEAKKGNLLVVFRDNGPGIPLEVREKVFTPFFTTKARGTGLGLPTARRLIEAHRGNIRIECPPQGGTAVTVELPVHE